jgi:hypothetical protein
MDNIGNIILILVWVGGALLVLVTVESVVDWIIQRKKARRLSEHLLFVQKMQTIVDGFNEFADTVRKDDDEQEADR